MCVCVRLRARVCAGGVEDLITYVDPMSSLIACIIWQLLVLYPRFLPSMYPLLLLRVMRYTYKASRAQREGILQTPSFFDYMCALILPRFLYKLPPIPEAVKAPQYPLLKQKAIIAERLALEKEREEREAAEYAAAAAYEEAYQSFENNRAHTPPPPAGPTSPRRARTCARRRHP